MKRALLGAALLAGAAVGPSVGGAGAEPPVARASAPEAVVVLHGLARSPRNMQRLADRIAAAGYEVHNLGYPSTRGSLPEWVDGLRTRIDACCAEAPKLHFVTHSLGGIVTRALLEQERPANLGRVVMLAPPNRGSEWVDQIGGWPAFRVFFGAVATELGTGDESLPNRLPPADFPLGVIAGDAKVNPVGAWLVPGDSDGTVSVARTRLEGMDDFIVVPHSHTFIMDAPRVASEALHFLEKGRFRDAAERPGEGS